MNDTRAFPKSFGVYMKLAVSCDESARGFTTVGERKWRGTNQLTWVCLAVAITTAAEAIHVNVFFDTKYCA